MFDAILHPGAEVKSRWGAGLLVAVFFHAAVIGGVLLTRQAPQVVTKQPPIVWFPRAGGPPPLAARAAVSAPATSARRPRTGALIQPQRVLAELPPAPPQPAATPAERGTDGSGSPVGKPGGTGTDPTATGAGAGADIAPVGPPPTGPVIFSPDMELPSKVSGPELEYTQAALDHGVQGEMSVRCIVSTTGAVHNCRVVRGLPFMDSSVIDALQHRRYTPARLKGVAIEVDYVFHITFALPE